MVSMKMAKVSEPAAGKQSMEQRKAKKSKFIGVTLEEADEELFERLRLLRTEIAQEEKLPPYIVFTDKTLVHRCLLPYTK